MNWLKHAETIEYLRWFKGVVEHTQRLGKASTKEVEAVESTIEVMLKVYTEDWKTDSTTQYP